MNKPSRSDLLLGSLRARFPEASSDHLSALAEIWSQQLDGVIQRMLEICSREQQVALPLEEKEHLIFELAKLTVWLGDRVIERNLQGRNLEDIELDAERASLASDEIKQRVENTARNCADGIWKRVVQEAVARHPRVLSSAHIGSEGNRGARLSQGKHLGVRAQHYAPVFANKRWASGKYGRVRVYTRAISGELRARDVGYKTWGREDFLYSQRLERLFHLIEGDARLSYGKLLNMVPLTEQDRRHWVAFMIAQLFRTPRATVRQLRGLRDVILRERLAYATDVGSLRQAFETLFTNNAIFAHFYRLFRDMEWGLWRASAGANFVRSDEPIAVVRDALEGRLQFIYPMSPDRCLVIGPRASPSDETMRIVPMGRDLSFIETMHVNATLARNARSSVLARVNTDDAELRSVLESHLAAGDDERSALDDLAFEFWGDLAGKHGRGR